MAILDFKDDNGEWVRGITIGNGTTYTRLGAMYGAMKSRCRVGGAVQKARPTYKGCICLFDSFKDFADWAVSQIGYNQLDWHLDKDVILKGNKTYSKETCVFLPHELNTVLLNRSRDRGAWPVGVTYREQTGKFCATCTHKKKVYNLGYFNNSEDAFAIYKEFKENIVRNLAEAYKGQIDPRAYQALSTYEVNIDD